MGPLFFLVIVDLLCFFVLFNKFWCLILHYFNLLCAYSQRDLFYTFFTSYYKEKINFIIIFFVITKISKFGYFNSKKNHFLCEIIIFTISTQILTNFSFRFQIGSQSQEIENFVLNYTILWLFNLKIMILQKCSNYYWKKLIILVVVISK